MQCYMVFRHREVNGAPAYLLRRCDTGEVKDLVLESDCMDFTVNEIIDKVWPSFVYTGDNAAASKWITKNLLNKVQSLQTVSYGPISNGEEYRFSCTVGSWTKPKS